MNWREREAMKEKQRREDEVRRAEEERLRGVRLTGENFPSLGMAGGTPAPKPITAPGVYAHMAKDWKQKDDLESFRERERREKEAREARRYEMGTTFRMSRFSPQPDDYEDVELPGTPSGDGWTQVDTKKKRVQRDLSIEEMEERDRQQAEAEQDYEQNADVADSMYRREFY